MTIKHQVLAAIQRLPDDIDFRDLNEEIALLAAVEEAEEDIRGEPSGVQRRDERPDR